jgi:hypothetical protein
LPAFYTASKTLTQNPTHMSFPATWWLLSTVDMSCVFGVGHQADDAWRGVTLVLGSVSLHQCSRRIREVNCKAPGAQGLYMTYCRTSQHITNIPRRYQDCTPPFKGGLVACIRVFQAVKRYQHFPHTCCRSAADH